MRVSLLVWVKTSLTWLNVLNFTLYNYVRHGFFIKPPKAKGHVTPAYYLFVDPSSLYQLRSNLNGGRTNECDVNENWNGKHHAHLLSLINVVLLYPLMFCI